MPFTTSNPINSVDYDALWLGIGPATTQSMMHCYNSIDYELMHCYNSVVYDALLQLIDFDALLQLNRL